MNQGAVEKLKNAVGEKGFSMDPAEIAPLLEEWRSKYKGRSPLLLKPSTTSEVSKILSICHETGTPIVPQGGNRGLVGGQIPFDGEALLSLARLKRVRSVDVDTRSLVAEAGAVLSDVQRTADEAGLLFPLILAAEGLGPIVGTISTNTVG